ncbi:hypothetical protein FOMPIDRAFT_48168 [Fomitopsis schrenkii]|uniref:HAT C-terminal dimerisation domain-containing protein n=1 Tax=Fomitopsis schrenkii TaxID=2126942 RepID=S8F416_FOMSC|nr:hypothetical protein FOMPIDRAFT_48168 [Fomitopsis schrenkii]
MERYGIHFSPENGQIRCLAHVVNLVVQQILSALINADDPTVNDWYLLHKFLPFHYDVEGDEELRALEDDEMAETDEKLTELCQDEEKDEALNLDEISNPVQKLRVIVRKIVSSPQRRSSFRKHARRHYKGKPSPSGGKELSTLMPVRDVPLTLLPDDWELLQQTASLLGVRILSKLSHINSRLRAQQFTHVTHIMSKSSMPTLPWVLPMYEHMKSALTNAIKAPSTHSKIAYAAHAGLKKLDEYYVKADACQYNKIATICHPTLRAKWFNKLGEDARIRAEALFKHVFREYELKIPKAADTPVHVTPKGASDSFLDMLAEVPEAVDSTAAAGANVEQVSEVDRWFRMEGGKGDPYHPLLWWKV